MTAKEKARELFENFLKYQTHTIGFEVDSHSEFVRQQRAKQCALICVDEILQDGILEKAPFMNNGKDMMKSNFVRYKDYWQQVKSEIEKL